MAFTSLFNPLGAAHMFLPHVRWMPEFTQLLQQAFSSTFLRLPVGLPILEFSLLP